MHTFSIRWLMLALLLIGASATAQAPSQWVAGKHYFLVQGPQQVSVAPGKIEVAEAFSYACSGCNSFYPIMERLKGSLPGDVEVVYLHAGFNDGWKVFQRAFYTAQVLKLADKAHEAMFAAIWKTGELALMDSKTRRPRKITIEDLASFYNRTAGVETAKFLSVAKGFNVEGKISRADKLVRAYGVDSTPTMIVNGRYRLSASSAGGEQEMIQLVKWLVAKESLQRSASTTR